MLEYVASFVMEKLFGSVFWDYSEKPLNLQGRICLQYSLYWGFLGLLLIYVLDRHRAPGAGVAAAGGRVHPRGPDGADRVVGDPHAAGLPPVRPEGGLPEGPGETALRCRRSTRPSVDSSTGSCRMW